MLSYQIPREVHRPGVFWQLWEVRESVSGAVHSHGVDPLLGEHDLLLNGREETSAVVPGGTGRGHVLGVVLHHQEELSVVAIVGVATAGLVHLAEDRGGRLHVG